MMMMWLSLYCIVFVILCCVVVLRVLFWFHRNYGKFRYDLKCGQVAAMK